MFVFISGSRVVAGDDDGTYMKKYLIKNYMRAPVLTIDKKSTLKDAVKRMVDGHTNGLVVVNDGGKKVVGILSSMDIISYIVPDYLEEDKHLASFEPHELFESRIRELADHPIKKFMTARVNTIRPDHTIMEASALLSEHKIRQLPVVDSDGNLVGYINRTDIKRAIGEVLGIQ